MTYRELINQVLIRLREDTIATDWAGNINDAANVSAYHYRTPFTSSKQSVP